MIRKAFLGALCASALTGSAFATDLYNNTPGTGETVFTSGSSPRTSGADEALFDGAGALITDMQFGYSVAAGGPAAFDVRVRMFDDIDAVTTTGPQFLNQVADFTLAFTGQTAGAFITSTINLTGLPGGGVSVTSNPTTLGVPNLTDVYVQLSFYQTGTHTLVPANGVTFLFDGTGVNVGRTFADPLVGGDGTAATELYWRDANANDTITADEARNFAAPNRANFVLRLGGTIVPEPTTLLGLGLAGLAFLRRR
ncbi:MAG: PEP-CTERM sorting domain-containing protein [Phycisphaerae bacterium]